MRVLIVQEGKRKRRSKKLEILISCVLLKKVKNGILLENLPEKTLILI